MPLLEKEISHCEQCGAPLKSGSSALGCLNCLLLGGPNEFDAETRWFQHYEICLREDGATLDELGRGAMGITYHAQDINLDSPVALKVINADHSGNAEARDRFLREARSAAQLRHPNVARVFHFGETEAGQCFYAMELVEGETLEARVRRDGPLPATLALEVATQVARALIAAEAHGLVHRDLKPSNLMVVAADLGGTDALLVKIIDFGLAKAVAALSIAPGLAHAGFSGTPDFASPEQFSAGEVALDVRSDIYSLGATLWYLLCGQAPHPGRRLGEVYDQPLSLEQLNAAKVPKPVLALLRSMLAPDPAGRPQSARDLLAALQRCRRIVAGAPRRKLAALALGLLLLSAAGLTNYLSQRPRVPAPVSTAAPAPPEKSIAVLPFENLSDDKQNAYFADGMQEEILTDLAKIADLKVISRTSVMQYKSGVARNLREIGQQLGVVHLLEGSVQRAGGKVRVNAQLIDARNAAHVWGATYDRKITDIFEVESEVAKAIAESLQVNLTRHEEHVLAIKPTNSVEAYDAYLRGLAFETRVAYYPQSTLEKAAHFYEQAVRFDPAFALAWARLSRANAQMYSIKSVPTEACRNAAEQALKSAQRLQPNSPETLLAQGFYQHLVLGNNELARLTFAPLRNILPGSSDVTAALALIARGQGRWDESVAYWEQTLVLDPRNIQWLMGEAETYRGLRQFPAALKIYDRALDISPDNVGLITSKIDIYHAMGDLGHAGQLLAGIKGDLYPSEAFTSQVDHLVLERRFDEALRLLKRELKGGEETELERAVNHFWLAEVQALAGDTAGSKAGFQKAAIELERLCQEDPTNARFPRYLSWVYANLGLKDAALKEGGRAIALEPSSNNPWVGPKFEERLAEVEAAVGEGGRSIARLQHLLQIPYVDSITRGWLRLDPAWDPLRNDPRFQRLLDPQLEP